MLCLKSRRHYRFLLYDGIAPRVLSNEAYEKPDQYGDDTAAPGNMLVVDARADVPGQPDDMRQKLAELKPGLLVRITQKHYYADLGDEVMPVRPITQLDVLNGGACKDIPSAPQDPANHDHEVMPLPL